MKDEKKLKLNRTLKILSMISLAIVLFLGYSRIILYAKGISAESTYVIPKGYDINESSLVLSDFVDAGESFVDSSNISDDGETGLEDEEDVIDTLLMEDNEQGISVPESDNWKLILVNKQNPVPENYEVELKNIGGSMMVDKRIASKVCDMINDAKEDGVELVICSAFRSYERQNTLFNNKIKKMVSSGMTYMDAYSYASYSVTTPGNSEHQLGLALDIVSSTYSKLDEGFANTREGKWLATHASEYGFILRYPEGKENITGITYEPWHFRYVGEKYAGQITKEGLTLEEYVECIR